MSIVVASISGMTDNGSFLTGFITDDHFAVFTAFEGNSDVCFATSRYALTVDQVGNGTYALHGKANGVGKTETGWRSIGPVDYVISGDHTGAVDIKVSQGGKLLGETAGVLTKPFGGHLLTVVV